MKIRLLSDLHLELANIQIEFDTKADIVILAGDIGSPYKDNYNNLLKQLSSTHEKVFIITGNHEYYQRNHTMHKTESKIRTLCALYSNVHFLQKESYIYKGIRFVGCTLWSCITDSTLCKYMNDFTYIPNFSFDKYITLHDNHKIWLRNELDTTGDFDMTCVITHHLPNLQLISEKYKDSPLNSFFASDININGANIWCYGHSHMSNYKIIDGVHFYCNPHGYSHEKTNWNPNMIINQIIIL